MATKLVVEIPFGAEQGMHKGRVVWFPTCNGCRANKPFVKRFSAEAFAAGIAMHCAKTIRQNGHEPRIVPPNS